MTFGKLLEDTTCNCVENAEEDTLTIFARKINKPIPIDKDFLSHWDRGKRAEGCKNICGLKGLSMNKWDDISKNSIIKKFVTTFSITPKHKDSIFVFKMKPNAGMVKDTPSTNDKSHYDFYKSDDFTLGLLDNQIIISLNDYVKNEKY